MTRKRYSTDVSDREWALLEPLVPAAKPGGRPCRWERREILNGILYVLRTGGTWRLLPHDFPPWQTVYHYFRGWRRDGTLQTIHDRLRAQARIRLGRQPDPTAAIIDSQSVKTTERGGTRGDDGGKQVKGRKRPSVVDTQGFLLKVVVHAADIQDRDGGKLVLAGLKATFPTLRHLWVDSGYRGQFVDWVKQTLGWSVEVVEHWWTGNRGFWVAPGQEPPKIPTGFQVLQWRWIVERSFAWMGRYRRLSKDYEYLVETSEAMVYTAMSRTMLARLARLAP